MLLCYDASVEVALKHRAPLAIRDFKVIARFPSKHGATLSFRIPYSAQNLLGPRGHAPHPLLECGVASIAPSASAWMRPH